MNINNELHIKIAVLSKVLHTSIIVMNKKYNNRLSNKIIPTQINMFNI
jgi:hypothetical protein